VPRGRVADGGGWTTDVRRGRRRPTANASTAGGAAAGGAATADGGGAAPVGRRVLAAGGVPPAAATEAGAAAAAAARVSAAVALRAGGGGRGGDPPTPITLTTVLVSGVGREARAHCLRGLVADLTGVHVDRLVDLDRFGSTAAVTLEVSAAAAFASAVRGLPAAAGLTLLDGVSSWSPAVLGPVRHRQLSAEAAAAMAADLCRRRLTAKRAQLGRRLEGMEHLWAPGEAGRDALFSVGVLLTSAAATTRVPAVATHALAGADLLLLAKPGGVGADGMPGLRPIGMPKALRKLAASALAGTARAAAADLLAPVQLGVGVANACERILHELAAHLAQHPDHAVLQLDFRNAFNLVYRSAAAAVLHRSLSLLTPYLT